jgi:hypothetical protein
MPSGYDRMYWTRAWLPTRIDLRLRPGQAASADENKETLKKEF